MSAGGLDPFSFHADPVRHKHQFHRRIGDHVIHHHSAELGAHVIYVDAHRSFSPSKSLIPFVQLSGCKVGRFLGQASGHADRLVHILQLKKFVEAQFPLVPFQANEGALFWRWLRGSPLGALGLVSLNFRREAERNLGAAGATLESAL
jgi:hypothetical protein